MSEHTRWWLAVVVALALPVQGCGTGTKGEGSPPDLDTQMQGAITLEGFAGCVDLEAYAKDLTKQQIAMQYDAWAEGGCWGCGFGWATPMSTPATDGASGGAAGEPTGGQGSAGGGSTDKGEAGVDYSTTTVQEEGVDEADFVKTDGRWLYLLRGGALVIVDAVPAETMKIVSTTPIGGSPLEMFVDGDRAVVFSSHGSYDVAEAARPDPQGPKAWNDRLRLTVIDVTDREAPVVLREVLLEGSYLSARLTGGAVHAVLRTYVGLATQSYGGVAVDVAGGAGGGTSGSGGATTGGGVDTSGPVSGGGVADAGAAVEPDEPGAVDPGEPTEPGEPTDPGDDRDGGTVFEDTGGAADDVPTWKEQLAEAKAAALAEVDALTMTDLVPLRWEVTRSDDGTEILGAAEPITDCGDFWRPSLAYGPSLVSVVTLRLDDPANDGVISVFGNGDTVYASPGRLYLAADIYNGWYGAMPDKAEDWQQTAIHVFDLAYAVDRAVYLGSGKVPGRVLNQFSLSEYEGDLRVATTKDLWTQGPDASESRVTVLGLQGGALVEKGSVGGLGKGERIYAARFLGPKGFVVTFKQTDPLYTLDLSDPTAPAVVGELKIPGFSTYIHPFGEDHLLTIGRDTFDNGQWVQVGGVQLTIFDVSDLAAPTQAWKEVLGEGGTQSDALYDHKAFTFLASRGLLVVPLSSYGSSTVGPTPDGGPGVVPAGEPDRGAADPAAGDTDEPAAGDEPPAKEQTWFTGAAVYDVSAETGFHERGVIDHTDLVTSGSWWSEHVSRAVIIGETVYTVGVVGMKASALVDLSEAGHVLFPADTGGGGGVKPMPTEGGATADGGEGGAL